MSTAARNRSTSKAPSLWTKRRRLNVARLQAESSMLMYSEHGLEPLMRPDTGEVCQSLIVVSNCILGAPHSHAASAISRRSARAFTVSMTAPSTREVKSQPAYAVACFMNSRDTWHEELVFGKLMDCQTLPVRLM